MPKNELTRLKEQSPGLTLSQTKWFELKIEAQNHLKI